MNEGKRLAKCREVMVRAEAGRGVEVAERGQPET